MLSSTYRSRFDFALQEFRSLNREAVERNKIPNWLGYSIARFSYVLFFPFLYGDSFDHLEKNPNGTYTDVLGAFGERVPIGKFNGRVREIREDPSNRRWEVVVENDTTYSWRTKTKPRILPEDTVSVRFANAIPYAVEFLDEKTTKLWGQEPTVRKLPVPI